jgi:hypothetical protein
MGMYRTDPNDSTKQVPNIQGENRFDRAATPQTCSFVKSPNYVVVNTLLTTPVGFFFGDSSSFASKANAQQADARHHLTHSMNYTTMLDDGTVGTKLNIQPTAWSGSAADAGKITFVYKSGLATGGF